MKRYLILLFTLCSILNSVCAQTPSAAIDSLIKFRVITAKQRPILLKSVKNTGYPSQRIAILGGLQSIMLQKTFHINPRTTGLMYFGYDNGNLNKKKQDSANISLRLLLEKIRKAGLLTDRVYTNTLNGIDSGQYMMDVQLTGHLVKLSSRLEWLAPNKLMPVAEQLHKNEMVSDSSFQRLEDDISNNKIESAFQLNSYCKFDRTFNPEKYGDSPEAWLEQIHRDIATMLPGLNFTNFSYTTLPDTSFSIGGVPGVRFKVSLTCDGRVYKHTSMAFFRNKQGKLLFEGGFGGDFHRIFNKILADEQSPYRLHLVMFSRPDDGDNYHRFTLIALREEQAEVFTKQPCRSYMFTSLETHDKTLTSARIDSAIVGWKRIGLFAHLSEEEINKAADDATADDLLSINYLLTKFPEVTYSLNNTMMSTHNTYRDVLVQLAEITHGAFNPTKITQRKVKGGVKLQYLAGGKTHSYTFESAYAWMDAKFPAFMNGLAEENNLTGKFYPLRYEGGVVYLTKQQHDDLVKNHLRDFGKE